MAFDFINKTADKTVANEIKVQLRPQFVKMVQRMSAEKTSLFYNGHHCIEMCILGKYNELYAQEIAQAKTIRPQVIDNTGFPSDDGNVDLLGNNFGGIR